MSEETIPQMRENIDRLEKQVKDLSASNSGLTKDNRGLLARDMFREEGYDAVKGELYAAQNPEGDITVDSVNEFAAKFGFEPAATVATPPEEGESKPQTPPPGDTKLAEMARSGSRAGDGGVDGSSATSMTVPEWQVLYKSDRAAADAAVRQGRVAGNTTDIVGNPYA